MNRADKHLGHTGQFAESFACTGDDALLQLGGGLFGECKCNDVSPAKESRFAPVSKDKPHVGRDFSLARDPAHAMS